MNFSAINFETNSTRNKKERNEREIYTSTSLIDLCRIYKHIKSYDKMSYPIPNILLMSIYIVYAKENHKSWSFRYFKFYVLKPSAGKCHLDVLFLHSCVILSVENKVFSHSCINLSLKTYLLGCSFFFKQFKLNIN